MSGVTFDGKWTAPEAVADVIEPATGKKLGRIGMAGPAEIASAAAKARLAQPVWAAVSYERRAEILRTADRVAEEHREEIADWLVRESGSIRPKAEFEVTLTIKALCHAALNCKNAADHA
ncbi:aldehyde dehydrogenase family protein [Phyllobacterium zundukense]|uniref:Aldehyde dehydrogenase domain-containing protein n=1 Tax=Phyllobacterium zundukense TaxID=1867719 RepID=A0A2N9VZP4_9HYPH|nr:aldehyde dehydrogenase family protein [Phyllobacterium zundukense]ATU94327.1 hypothetical protein BLM14_21500 [Phyllobacterium zundukense]PIO44962.1 hypothetical protein B5P45_09860 [Phyllobacterium zundukense]